MSFNQKFMAIQDRLALRQEDQKVILDDLFELAKQEGRKVFLWETRYTDGFEIGFVPNDLKVKTKVFAFTTMMVSLLKYMEDNKGYTVTIKNGFNNRVPELMDGFKANKFLFVAKALYLGNFSLVATSSATTDLAELYHDRLYNDKQAGRRVTRPRTSVTVKQVTVTKVDGYDCYCL